MARTEKEIIEEYVKNMQEGFPTDFPERKEETKKEIKKDKSSATTSAIKSADESKRNLEKIKSDLLGLCAAVFSVIGGYKDALRVGGFATWSMDYNNCRRDSNLSTVSSTIDEREPLLLVLSIHEETQNCLSCSRNNDCKSSKSISLKSIRGSESVDRGLYCKDIDFNAPSTKLARVKIVKGIYRTETSPIHKTRNTTAPR